VTAFFDHLHYAFFQHTLAACLVVGAACALFSTYVVLRRLVFAGVALTQLSSAGLGLAALTGLAPLPVSLAATVLGVGLLALVRPGQKARTDNLVALLYIGGWAASVLLFAVAERGDTELAAVLYGDILGVLASDIYAFVPVALLVSVLILTLGKEFLFVSFDPETAATYRLPVWLYDTAMFCGLGIVIVFATKMLGLLLVFAFLVAPGTAALMVSKRMGAATVVSVLFSLAMSVVGLAASAAWDLPPGPAVTAAGLVLLGGLCVAIRLPLPVAARPRTSPDQPAEGPLVPTAAPRRETVRARTMGLDREAWRTLLVVAALALIAAASGALSSRVASERTSGILSGHEHEAHTPHDAAGARPVPPSGAVENQDVTYGNSVGGELPAVDGLLGNAEP